MDVLLGISIVIVYFMFGILTAAIYKVDEPLDVFLAAFLWPIMVSLYAIVILVTFSFSLGEKLGNKLDKQLDKLIFREKK